MTAVYWCPTKRVDESILEKIRKSGPVEELTVSKVYIPFETSEGVFRFRVYNTDPKNWNIFMFPFEAQKLQKKIDAQNVARYASNILNLVGDDGDEYKTFSTGDVETQAEIKFSKSSNLNTLYVFFYKICNPSDVSFSFEHRDLEFSSAEDAKDFFAAHEHEFATNVPSVVSEVIDANS